MPTNYARYIWYRLVRSWYGLVYVVLYVAVTLAATVSSERSLRGWVYRFSRESWHTDCLEAYGNTLIWCVIFGSMFVAWLFLSDFQTGFGKNLLAGRRSRASYAGLMVIVALALACVSLAVGVAVVELVYLVMPSWLDRPDVGTCCTWFAQAFLLVALGLCVAELAACLVRDFTLGMVAATLLPWWLVTYLVQMDLGTEEVPSWLAGVLSVERLFDGGTADVQWTLFALAAIALTSTAIVLVVRRKRLA